MWGQELRPWVGFRVGRFFLDVLGHAVPVETDHAVALRVMDVVGEHRGAAVAAAVEPDLVQALLVRAQRAQGVPDRAQVKGIGIWMRGR